MIDETFKLLGRRARDRVTGFKGVTASVAFDLSGCVQLFLTPGAVDKDGKIGEGHWFDVNRVEVSTDLSVMPPPDFSGYFAKAPEEYNQGAMPKKAPRP